MCGGMDMHFWAEAADAPPGELAASDLPTRSGRQTDGGHEDLTTGPGVPAWLIVSMERPVLYDYLRQRIEAGATGQAIGDRRLGERGQSSNGREPVRRQSDRRLRAGGRPRLT